MINACVSRSPHPKGCGFSDLSHFIVIFANVFHRPVITINALYMNIIEFDTIDSTNRQCGRMDLRTVAEFTTVWAHRQTDGIGQRGNHWVSEDDMNLTFSIILHPTFLLPARQYELTKAMALGVSDWLMDVGNGQLPVVKIKWPNDIYADGHKICGMLIENQIGECYETAVCGIGVNINQTEFGDGAPNATSLKAITGRTYELRGLLENLLINLQKRYEELKVASGQWSVVSSDQLSATSLDRDYLARLMNLGETHRYIYNGQAIRATITGVSQWGHLQLTTLDGDHLQCAMKEITFDLT